MCFATPGQNVVLLLVAGADLASVFGFLLQLGFRQVGQPASLKELGAAQRAIAAHMMQLGLLCPFQARCSSGPSSLL